MRHLSKLFNPGSIAIVGASPKRGKLGHVLLENIEAGGWRGKIFCVNPKHTRIGKHKCYANLSDIQKPVDAVLIAVPAPFVNGVIENGSGSSPKIINYVIISAGFKESGKAGRKLEDYLKNLAENRKLNVLGPNCLGFVNAGARLNATFTGANLLKGKIAIVSQSGALAVALLDWAEKLEIGFSKIISIGNKAVLDESTLLEYLEKDTETKAIALYLEDMQDGLKFISAAQDASCVKPIILLKAGRNKTGQKAISSHTGSLAQDDAIVRAVIEKFGIIQAESFEEFQDIISFLSFGAIPDRNECIVVTNAGGLGVLAADFAGKAKNISLLKMRESVKKELQKILPSGAAVANPIDVLGDAAPERYEKVLGVLAKRYPRCPLLLILTPQSQTHPREVAKVLTKYRNFFPSLAASFAGGAKINSSLSFLRKSRIASFDSPERALDIFDKIGAHHRKDCRAFRGAGARKIRLPIKSNAIIQNALSEGRKILRWKETEKIFARWGVSLMKSVAISRADSPRANLSKIKFPCVLKSDEPDIAHRWDKKAVALDLKSEKGLRSAAKKMRAAAKVENFIVQPYMPGGLEIIVGMKRDSSFGPVIMAGWGGTYAEVVKDNVILIPPIRKSEVSAKLKELKMHPVLGGFRGEKKYDTSQIANILAAIQNIAVENPDIAEIDINPLILYNDGRKSQIVDAKMFLEKSSAPNN